jgi:uncharacterized coiled-coil protein SlyX
MPHGIYERTKLTREDYIRKFWEKVDKNGPNGCWIWIGAKNNKGYGNFSNNIGSKTSHRFSFELANGKIEDGLIICHKCDNPPCVNPDHLFKGTHADNMQDAINKGRLNFNAVGSEGPRRPNRRSQEIKNLREELAELREEVDKLKERNERLLEQLRHSNSLLAAHRSNTKKA